MASDTNITAHNSTAAKSPPWARHGSVRKTGAERSIIFSSLARVIFLSNLIGLFILISGSMALTRYTHELVSARIDNLHSKAKLVTSIIGENATGYDGNAALDSVQASQIIAQVDLPEGWRIRLHDRDARLVADSDSLTREITQTSLDPIQSAPPPDRLVETSGIINRLKATARSLMYNLPWRKERRERLRRNLNADIRNALSGQDMGGERYDENDNLIVTVSTPVRRVQQVLGVVTLESDDVQDIIASERRALTPFIGLAILAALLSSIALTMSLALPLRHLTRAAEDVAKSSDKRGQIPDYSARGDEIGDLSVVLRKMTSDLYSRIDDIANFAADVAHEIKNPLTSLRSASDTLKIAKNDEQRNKLINIIQDDVARMDRLISDISNASKIDASLARESAKIVDINTVLANMAEFYSQTRAEGGAAVVHAKPARDPHDPAPTIRAFELPFAQVIRNLIDNALTFSPKDGVVTLSARLEDGPNPGHVIIHVEDDGPGIPTDNLETIFERFYTERPKGAQFGSHSGLGLAICRQIITAHKGRIFAQNRVEGGQTLGARFVITLPFASATQK